MTTILVFRSGGLGDFILSTPALFKIREFFKDAKIILLTDSSRNSSIRDRISEYTENQSNYPWVELVTPHLIDQSLTLGARLHISHLLNLRKQIRSEQVEKVFLLLDPCSPYLGRLKKLALLIFLVGFKPIYGWRSRGSLRHNKRKLKDLGLLKHHVWGPMESLLEFNPSISFSPSDVVFDLRPTRIAMDWAENWITNHLRADYKLIAISPGSIQPHKRWPLESFKGLIGNILSKYPKSILIIIGTAQDHDLGRDLEILDASRIFNLCGISSIQKSAALLKRTHVLIGNDGGSIHLGDAMGTKVISIVPGIEFEDSIEPWNNRQNTIRLPIACAPCYSFTYCPLVHNKCMTNISIESVLERLDTIL